MADLIPVDHNPFTSSPKLVPVEGNPFSDVPQEKRSYSIGEVPEHAVSNFLSSLGTEIQKMGEGAWDAITSPAQTAGNVLKLATTTSPLMGPLIRGAADLIGPRLSDENRLLLEGVVHDMHEPQSALVKDLTEAYGDWDSVKRTLAENPARALMDAATIATGGQLALAKAPGALGTIGRAAGKVGDVIDPISAAAKLTTKVVDPAVRGVFGTQTGSGGASLAEAARTGFVGGDAGTNFRRAYNEGVPVEEIVGAAQQGVQTIKQKMHQIYEARKNDPKYGWGNDPTVLDFTPITKAWQDLVDSYTTKSGQRKVGDAEWNQIQKVGDVVSEWEKNPALRTADDFDGLKQRIRAIYPDGEAPQLRRAVTRMASVVGGEIKAQVPGYHRAMKDYSVAADNLWEMERAFSLGDKASMQTAMSKLQSVMRNNANTSYGLRNKKLDEIEAAGNTEIRPFIAGNTLSSWEPRSFARVGSNMGVTGLAAALAGGLPGAAIGAALGLAASSPKLVGGLYHGAGRIAGAPDRLAEKLIPQAYRPSAGFAYSPFKRPARLGARALEMSQPEEEEPQFRRGGYFRGTGR